MAENRLDRELETRERTSRKRAWTKPELLPHPKDENGYTFRYVRTSTQGRADPTNVNSKLREGWEPVKATDYPDIYSEVGDARFKDNITIGGLMLCKAPVELVEERSEFYRNQTEAQMRSVDNNLMRESDARMPIFNERKSNVSFGRGN